MAQFCSTNDISFITYSTDYVFGGEAERPWLESDSTDPINAYGRSKRVGEQLTLEHGGLVIRTSWVVSGTHPNFVATMLRHSRDRILRVVNDQHGCPTIAHDLAEATARIGTGASGLVHLVNTGETTWFDFAQEGRTPGGNRSGTDRGMCIERVPDARRPACLLGARLRTAR